MRATLLPIKDILIAVGQCCTPALALRCIPGPWSLPCQGLPLTQPCAQPPPLGPAVPCLGLCQQFTPSSSRFRLNATAWVTARAGKWRQGWEEMLQASLLLATGSCVPSNHSSWGLSIRVPASGLGKVPRGGSVWPGGSQGTDKGSPAGSSYFGCRS